MRNILPLFLLMVLSSIAFAQTGANDPTFNPGDIGFGYGDGASNTVITAILQPDGKILISGNFHDYNGSQTKGLARLNANGTLDTSFSYNTSPGVNVIDRMVLQPDGKILIAGYFTSNYGTGSDRVVRLNQDGSFDNTFQSGTGANHSIKAMTLQPDGKILIGGNFNTYDNAYCNRIVRLNADGSLDTSFKQLVNLNSYINSIAVQPDAKIIIGGNFSFFNDIGMNRIARLNADGTIDNSFDSGDGPDKYIHTIELQPDGKIIIAGEFSSFNGSPVNRIARLSSNGTLDTSFYIGAGPAGIYSSRIHSVVLQPDEKIIVGGEFTLFNGFEISMIARLNSNGTFDTTFHPGLGPAGTNFPKIYTAIIQPDEKIIVGGNFTIFDGIKKNRITRLNSDGTVDITFNPGTGAVGSVFASAMQADGKIIIGGDFDFYNGVMMRKIARLNDDGTIDDSFDIGTGYDGIVMTCVIQANDKIIIGGDFTNYNGVPVNRIVRLLVDGTLDTTFNIGAGANGGSINTIAIRSDGKIYIGGNFSSYNGVQINRIARLNEDGSIDTSFNTGHGAIDAVNTISIQQDDKIIIGGAFTFFNATPMNRIARLNVDGSLDNSFNIGSGVDGSATQIRASVIQPDGKIIIGGTFTSFNGMQKMGFVRLNPNGTPDPSFNQGILVNGIYSITLQPNGKIIIAGAFSNFTTNRIARLRAGGTLDSFFDTGTGSNNAIRTVAFQPEGKKLIIGGDFTSYNGVGRNRIARIINCFANVDVVVSGSTITSIAGGAEYQWIDCDNNYLPIPGETSQTFTATSNGNYAVIVTQDICVDTSACVLIDNVGIENIPESKMRVYPNPVSDELIIEAEGNEERLTFEIFNTLGQIVHKGEFSERTIVQTSHFVSGLYVVKISDGSKFDYKKVIKK